MQIERISTSKECLRNVESPIVARRPLQQDISSKKSQNSDLTNKSFEISARQNDQVLTTVAEITNL